MRVYHLSTTLKLDIEELCEIIPGPDFPTGGLILGKVEPKALIRPVEAQ